MAQAFKWGGRADKCRSLVQHAQSCGLFNRCVIFAWIFGVIGILRCLKKELQLTQNENLQGTDCCGHVAALFERQFVGVFCTSRSITGSTSSSTFPFFAHGNGKHDALCVVGSVGYFS
ncbi:unnamed protein product [Ectocarpus sp. 12 AP-2014]